MELDAIDELRLRADEVLYYLWDPIGVSGAPMARDEYSAYASNVVAMLLAGDASNTIADYLGKIRTEHMSLDPNRSDDEKVAKRLLEWKAKLVSTRPRILGPK